MRSVPQRNRVIVVSGVAAAVIAGGGVAAYAATSPSTAPSAPRVGYGATPAAPVRPARSPHLGGTVVSSSSTRIIVTDPDGFQRTIDISSSTKFSDGLTAAVAKGTKIMAAGTVDSDKTSLDATTVSKMPTGPGPAGPGGPGRGGFGKRGPGPAGLHGNPPVPGKSGAPAPASPAA